MKNPKNQKTARKSTKEMVYRTLIDNMSSAVAVYRAVDEGNDFVFVDFNKAGEIIEQVSRDKVLGQRVTKCFPGVTEFGLIEVLKRVWETGKPERYPVKIYKDERIRGWRENFVYKLESGEVVTIYTDETVKMQALQSLKESELKFRTLFEQAPSCIAHMDGLGRFVDVNGQVTNTFGYSKSDFLCLNYRDLFLVHDKRKNENQIDSLLTGEGNEYVAETQLRHKSGKSFYAHISIKALQTSAANSKSFICIFEDISERKKSEQKIIESLKEKEILLREIHHRVKNNMQVICSLLSLQADFSHDVKTRDIFEEINQQIRAMSLAHEMLYQSSGIANFRAREYIMRLMDQIFGKTTNNLQKINLTQNIDDVCIDIDIAIPLGFIITELISNCVKHAFVGRDKGKVLISFRLIKNRNIELVISDDGVGISEGVDIKKPKSLGLELVGIFVQKLNGSVSYENNKPGTKVTVIVKTSSVEQDK